MANDSTKLGGKSLELDVFDLDRLDDGLSLDLKVDKTKGPIKRFAASFKRGFLEQTKYSQILKNTVRGALPDGYSRTLNAAESSVNAAREIALEVRRSNAHDLDMIARKAEQLLPAQRTGRTGKLYDKIESKLKSLQEELSYGLNNTSEAEHQRQADEAAIAAALGGSAELQRDIAVAQEASTQERDLRDRAERGVRDKVSSLRFDMVSRQLGLLTEHVGKQVAFQDQITYQFQRKSLEVQYRQFFMLRDIRKFAEITLDTNKRAYDALVHNTALPDHLKIGEAERVRFNLRDQAASKVSDKMLETLPGFLASFYPTIKENIKNKAKSAASTMGMAASMFDAIPQGGDRSAMLGEAIGKGAGAKVSSMAATRLAMLMQPLMERLSDKTGGSGNRLSYLFKNAPAMLREYTTDINQSSGWRGGIQSLVRSVVPTYFQDDRITDGSYQNIDRQAVFNQLTQRSIVEIIPGYLSRILHEARILRTGDPNTDREVYDLTSGKFGGYKEAKRRLMGRVISQVNRRDVNNSLDETIAQYDPENKLSPEAKEALRERLLRDAGGGGRFDPERYAEGGYAQETADATVDELRAFFKGQFEFDERGKLKGNLQNYKKRDQFSDQFLNLQSVTPDPRAEIRRLMGSGSQELLRDLGLLSNQNGQDRIDYSKVWATYRNQSNLTSNDTNIGAGNNEIIGDLSKDEEGEQVILHARDLEDGKYFDSMTGKVIHSVDEIVGGVKDQFGRVVAEGEELASGLYNQATGRKVFFRNLAERFKRVGGAINDFRRTVQSSFRDGLLNARGRLQDLYTAAKDRAVLLARDIQAGKYIDVSTERIITSVEDITGEVRDVFGNIVLTAEEFAAGLFTAEGERATETQSSGFWNKYLQITTAPAKALGKFLRKVGSTVSAWAWNKLTMARDAYVKGDENVRILANKLKNGFYYDEASGDQLTDFDQIKGSVVDRDGNVVLNADEVDQLVNRDGSKHRGAKKKGLLRRAAGAYWKMTKAYYRWLGRTSKKVGGKLLRGVGKLTGWGFGKLTGRGKEEEEPSTPSEGILARILGVLDRRLPAEENRKGSWQDIFARRGGQKKDEKGKGPEDRLSGKEPLAALGASLKKLFGFGKEQDEEEDDDDDTYNVDLGDGDSDGKRRGRKSRRPKGKLSRAWKATKGFGGKLVRSPVARTVARSALGRGAIAGAGMLATSAAGAGAALMGGLGTVATAIGGILAAPVVIGGAVLAGAAVGGYMYYTKRKRASGVFRELRLTQYGVSPNGWSQPGKLLDLEDLLDPITSRSEGSQPTVDYGRMDYAKFTEIFGIDETNKEDVQAMLGWFEGRFKPVYMTTQAALMSVAPDVRIMEVDEKLPEELGMRLLGLIKFPYSGNTPYAILTSPFGADSPIDITVDDIKRREQAVIDKYKDKAAKDGSAKTNWKEVGAAAGAAAVASSVPAIPTPLRPQLPGTGLSKANSVIDVALGQGQESIFSVVSNTQGGDLYNRPLTSLETIRLKAYGLDALTYGTVRDVLNLEEYVMQSLRIGQDGQATYDGKIDDLVTQFAASFGVSDLAGESGDNFRNWLRLRFLPVVVNFASSIHRVAPNAPLTYSQARLERLLNPVMQVSVAKAIIGAQVDYDGQRVGVWTVGYSPSGKLGNSSALEAAARAHLRLMEEEANNYEMTTKVNEAKAAQSGGVNSDPSLAAKAAIMGGNQSTAVQRASTQWGGSAAVLSNTPTPLQRGGVAIGLGNAYEGFGSGSGGAWETIPYPNGNRSKQAAMATLAAVEKMSGVSASLLSTFISIESGFDYLVKAATSSATGWAQFLDKTWDSMVDKYGKKYGFPPDQGRALRCDPRCAALMLAEFIRENYTYLEKALGRKPTDTDLYLAHFFGAGTAVKFLKTDTGVIASLAFPQQAAANKSIFYTPGGQARTVGEVYRLLDEKVNRHRSGGGGYNVQSVANGGVDLASPSASAAPGAANPVLAGEGETPNSTNSKAMYGLNGRANATVNPANTATPLVTATSGPTMPTAPTGGQAASDPQAAQREEAVRTAAATDQVQRQQVDLTMAASKELYTVMDAQLKVQTEMRDYLKTIASNLLSAGGGATNDSSRAPNGTSRSTNADGPAPSSAPAPVRMKNSR